MRITLLLLLVTGSLCFGQQQLDPAKSSMTIAGTSTLHDWTSDVETLKGKGSFSIEDGQVTAVSGFTFSVEVRSIKSGKGGMDKNTYEALKADDHPNITFQLTDATPTTTSIKTNGKLTIAGKTNPVQMDVTYKVQSDKSIECSGTYTLKMTDYDIDPPTAMMGTIKTGDEITVNFTVVFN